MIYRVLTDLTVLLHFGFLVFVVAGGFLARRYRWLVAPHLLAVAWGIYVDAMPGIICPLTTLEQTLAIRGGGVGYRGGFIAHYLLPVIYPDGLSRAAQWSVAAAVVLINAAVYFTPRRRRESVSGYSQPSP
jgi:hypothetical protein